jgi:hypothetical protein
MIPRGVSSAQPRLISWRCACSVQIRWHCGSTGRARRIMTWRSIERPCRPYLSSGATVPGTKRYWRYGRKGGKTAVRIRGVTVVDMVR